VVGDFQNIGTGESPLGGEACFDLPRHIPGKKKRPGSIAQAKYQRVPIAGRLGALARLRRQHLDGGSAEAAFVARTQQPEPGAGLPRQVADAFSLI
jgi:hypothetical protein